MTVKGRENLKALEQPHVVFMLVGSCLLFARCCREIRCAGLMTLCGGATFTNRKCDMCYFAIIHH